MLAAALPVMVLASPLPVPLMAAAPSSVRFSIAANGASERVMVEVMVSMPPAIGDRVGAVAEHIGVVARAADQRVGAEPAIEDVVAAAAGKYVVSDPAS